MRIGFAGSRFKYFKSYAVGYLLVKFLVEDILLQYEDPDSVIVYHGGNFKSVDAIVHEVARRLGFRICILYPESWNRKDLRKRTIRLAYTVDVMYCIFVDTISRGTKLAYDTARRYKKEVYAYFVDTVNSSVQLLD